MDKNGVITISDWTKGKADSPILGFGNMKNVDVFESPGVARISYRLTEQYTGDSGLAVARVKSINGDVYVLYRVEGGNSYLRKNGVNLTNVSGDAWDMVEYFTTTGEGYLIISSTTGLHCYGTTISTAYFSLWKTGLTSQYYVKLLVGSDNKLYIGNGNNVATITAFTVGSFAVAPTATLTLIALDLQQGRYVVTMTELRDKLMIGTQGGSAYSAIGSQRVADIFPWDRVSSSFELPLVLNETGIQAMITVGNYVYFMAGSRGNMYLTDGTSYRKIRRIPWVVDRAFQGAITIYPNALATSPNNNLLVGTSGYAGDMSTSELGVYHVELGGNNACTLKHVISTGNFNTNIKIGFIQSGELDTLYVGTQDATTFRVDTIASDSSYTLYSAVIESQFIRVGTRLNRKTFQNIEFTLSKPLISGQGIKLAYRKNRYANFTDIGTFDYATLGAVISHNTKCLIDDAEILQIQIKLTQDTTTGVSNTLELIDVKLW